MKSREPRRGIHLSLANLIAGVFVFFLGLILYFWAVPFHISSSFSAMKGIGPKTFPSAFSLIVAGLGAILVFKGYPELKRSRSAGSPEHGLQGEAFVRFTLMALVILAVGLLYSALLKSGGYLLVNTLSILILFKMFGGRQWWKGLLLGIGVTVCIYLFFGTYLDLAIPLGFLFEG
jgi:hypothetical protein